ncbi:MAG: hypothetical protein H5T96_06120 [Tissierellales bacterium]|nr:hypothetical protein [Tissierellales bacterium]
MKIIMKPIEMIAWFNNTNYPIPLRFRVETENKTNIVIKIDKIVFKEMQKIAGNRMIVYRCEGIISGLQRTFELKYEIDTCKWYLFKM